MLINGFNVNKNNLAYKAVSNELRALCGQPYTYNKPLGKWYEVAPNEETDNTVFCHQYGFHCARNPLDSYYSMGKVFLVEVGGDIDEEDTMLCSTKIRFIKELDDTSFVAHALNYEAQHPKMTSSTVMKTEMYESRCNSKFEIVRGKNPKVKAPVGTIVGIIKEAEDGAIEAMDMWIVDGIEYLPDKYYGITAERS